MSTPEEGTSPMKTESKGREKHEEKYPGEMQPKKMVMQNSWMKA